jgi:hypothetical protein
MSNDTEEEYYGPVMFEQCLIQRTFGLLFVCMIVGGFIVQAALINVSLPKEDKYRSHKFRQF